jgi:hypothetical protein
LAAHDTTDVGAGGAQFWLDQSGAIFLQVNYGKYPLEVQKGKTTVKCGY